MSIAEVHLHPTPIERGRPRINEASHNPKGRELIETVEAKYFSSWFETRKPNPNLLKLHAYKRQVESALYFLPLSSNKARRAASASLQTGPTAPHLKHRARRPLS